MSTHNGAYGGVIDSSVVSGVAASPRDEESGELVVTWIVDECN